MRAAFWDVYWRLDGTAWEYGSSGAGPLAGPEVDAQVTAQDAAARQLAAGLGPLSKRWWGSRLPTARGWQRITLPSPTRMLPGSLAREGIGVGCRAADALGGPSERRQAPEGAARCAWKDLAPFSDLHQ